MSPMTTSGVAAPAGCAPAMSASVIAMAVVPIVDVVLFIAIPLQRLFVSQIPRYSCTMVILSGNSEALKECAIRPRSMT